MKVIIKFLAIFALLALVIDGQRNRPGRTPSPTPNPVKSPRTTKAPPVRTKTTKAPRVRTKTTKAPRVRNRTPRPTTPYPTPVPTPMPTEECDCYSTTLVGRNVIGGNKCYKYEVDFCKPGMNSVILGDGNADVECGITDVMDIITNARLPPTVTYESTYRDGKVRGIKIDGLMSGDVFRICFDKNLVDGVMKGGFIEYQSYYGDVSCKQKDNLPELCPVVVSNAMVGGVRVKTTKAPKQRTKTTKPPKQRTTRYRSKTPRPTTPEPSPMPTPMPTMQCDCVSTELVARNVKGNNKCYRYEVNFCNDEINSITLGDGNADVECGVDFMDVVNEMDLPNGVGYEAVYNDKVRGIKLTGLVSGQTFRICYDKNVVDNTMKAGFIEYMTDAGDFSCKQSNNLPDLCPIVVSNAENGSGGAGKTDPCSCNSVTLTGTPYSVGETCYRYEVQFCNDNYDTIEMGMGNSGELCGTQIADVFKYAKPPSLQYEVGRPFEGDEHHARGIKIMGLSSGDKFTLCFKGTDFDVRQYGTIDFLNPRGREETCPVTDTLFDLCPTVDPPFPAKAEGGNVKLQIAPKDEHKHRPFESPTMIYMWSALCSALVSMAAVFIVYVSCIAPKGGIDNIRGYGKVLDSDEDEDEEEDSTEEEDESTESEEDEV